MKNRKKTRVQFELTERGVLEFDELEKITDVATKKELFDNAFTLLKWAVYERQNGRIIASVDEKNEKYKEIELPVLSRAAGKS